MEKLLTKYTIQDILMFIVILSLALKGLVSFIDWAYTRIKKVFDEQHENEQATETQDQAIAALKKHQQEMHEDILNLSAKIAMLVESDRDSIKSDLTKQHHFFCYTKGWIDDYSLECCERRFKHYQDEGGNSFIQGFMKELRELPKQPSA